MKRVRRRSISVDEYWDTLGALLAGPAARTQEWTGSNIKEAPLFQILQRLRGAHKTWSREYQKANFDVAHQRELHSLLEEAVLALDKCGLSGFEG